MVARGVSNANPEGSAPRARYWTRLHRSLRKNPASFGAVVVLLLVLVSAPVAPIVLDLKPNQQVLSSFMKPPGWTSPQGQRHLLGTDQLGRDVLARLVAGARTSIAVGLAAVVISGVVGVALGVAAGYQGGWIDAIVTALTEVQLAVPFILLTVTALGLFGASMANIILVLGISGWMPYARTVRAETLRFKSSEYVEASRALGAGTTRIMARHILPNILPAAIVISTLMVARAILAESALSFLGLGVRPPTVSWGGMLADGRQYVASAWWLSTFPGLAIMITVLSVNLVGDWLRDYLDPRLRGR